MIFGGSIKEGLFFTLSHMILTKINQHVFLFEIKKLCCDKTTYKKLISWEFIITSKISTLCSGCYMQVTKSLEHHLSGCWLDCTGGLYREKFDLKTQGRTTTCLLRTGGGFKNLVVKTGLTVFLLLYCNQDLILSLEFHF